MLTFAQKMLLVKSPKLFFRFAKLSAEPKMHALNCIMFPAYYFCAVRKKGGGGTAPKILIIIISWDQAKRLTL